MSELVVLLTDAQLDALADRVVARLANPDGNGHAPEVPDRLLTATEAAARLGMKPRWLYAHVRELGGVRVGRAVRFSDAGITRYIKKGSR